MPPQTPEKEPTVRGYSPIRQAPVFAEPTVDEASLAAAAEAYQRDGYFIARGLFSLEEVEDINALFHKMYADGGVPGFYEPGKLSPAETKSALGGQDPLVVWTRVMHPHRFNEKARAYMLHPKVRVYLDSWAESLSQLRACAFLRPPAHAVKRCTKITFTSWLSPVPVWPHGLCAMTVTPRMAA